MAQFEKLKVISALVFVINAVLLSIALIVAIWLGFEGKMIWRLVGTLFVLFLLSGVLHYGQLQKNRSMNGLKID